MPKYVAWGSYCDNVLEKRAPHRQAHLDGLSTQKSAGVLMTIGPTQDLSMFFAIYDAESEVDVRTLIEKDPYWQNGIWTEYFVKEWIQAM
ncbi:MAG: YciI family protein [Elainellaceae cyanobacterium]